MPENNNIEKNNEEINPENIPSNKVGDTNKHEAPTVEINKKDLEEAMALFKREIEGAQSFEELRDVLTKRGLYHNILESIDRIESALNDIFVDASFFKRNVFDVNKTRSALLSKIIKKESKKINLFDKELTESLKHKIGELFLGGYNNIIGNKGEKE
mgnify:CR=1 FL=1